MSVISKFETTYKSQIEIMFSVYFYFFFFLTLNFFNVKLRKFKITDLACMGLLGTFHNMFRTCSNLFRLYYLYSAQEYNTTFVVFLSLLYFSLL